MENSTKSLLAMQADIEAKLKLDPSDPSVKTLAEECDHVRATMVAEGYVEDPIENRQAIVKANLKELDSLLEDLAVSWADMSEGSELIAETTTISDKKKQTNNKNSNNNNSANNKGTNNNNTNKGKQEKQKNQQVNKKTEEKKPQIQKNPDYIIYSHLPAKGSIVDSDSFEVYYKDALDYVFYCGDKNVPFDTLTEKQKGTARYLLNNTDRAYRAKGYYTVVSGDKKTLEETCSEPLTTKEEPFKILVPTNIKKEDFNLIRDLASAYSLTVVRDASMNAHDHFEDQLARTLATKALLTKIKSEKVVDLYGNMRSTKIERRVTPIGERLAVKDEDRERIDTQLLANEYDDAIIIDCYHTTPEDIAGVCRKLRNKCVHFAVRDFRARIGAIPGLGSAWFDPKDRDSLIFVTGVNQSSYVSPASGWLFDAEGYKFGTKWMYKLHKGTVELKGIVYHLIKVYLCDEQRALDSMGVISGEPMVVKATWRQGMAGSRYCDWLRTWFPDMGLRTGWIMTGIHVKVSTAPPSPSTSTSIREHVERRLQEKDWQTCTKVFGGLVDFIKFKNELIRNTVAYYQYEERSETVQAHQKFDDATGDETLEYGGITKKIENRFGKIQYGHIALGLAAGAAGIWLMRSGKMSVFRSNTVVKMCTYYALTTFFRAPIKYNFPIPSQATEAVDPAVQRIRQYDVPELNGFGMLMWVGIEEFIKRVIPYGNSTIIVLEIIGDVIRSGPIEVLTLKGLLRSAAHSALSVAPYPLAVALHFIYNLFVDSGMQLSLPKVYEAIREKMESDPQLAGWLQNYRDFRPDLCGEQSFVSPNEVILDAVEAKMELGGNFDPIKGKAEYRDPQSITEHVFVPFGVLLPYYRPMQSAVNMKQAMALRLLGESPLPTPRIWKFILDTITPQINLDVEPISNKEFVESKRGNAKKRAIRGMERDETRGLHPCPIGKFMVKSDEVLGLKPTPSGGFDIKPRLILNTDVQSIVVKGKPIQQVYKGFVKWTKDNVIHFPRLINGEPKNQTFRYVIPYGLDADEVAYLMEYAMKVKDVTWTIFAMGDDGMAIGPNGYYYWDISHNDRSMSYWHHLCFLLLLRKNALFAYHMCLRTLFYGGTYKSMWYKNGSESSRITISAKDTEVQLHSGDLTVTAVNTTSLLYGSTYCLSQEDPESAFHTLGYKAKFFKVDSVYGLEFLKKWPVDLSLSEQIKYGQGLTGDLFSMIDLPSRICKAGKTLKTVEFITKTKGKHHLKAVAKWAYALWKQLEFIPEDYPVLGVYVARLREVSLEWDISKCRGNYDYYRLRNHTYRELDREFIIAAMYDRYGLDKSEILHMEDLLRQMPFPGVVADPGFYKLFVRDY